MTSSGHFWGQGVISRAPASVSIQCPEAVVFKVLLQDVSTRRQHVSVSRSGWAASRALREALLGGRGGWPGREDTAEGLCSLLFPRTCPTPDPCQALADRSAEDAVVPGWGEGSVRGGRRGDSTGVSAAGQVTFPSSSSPERALVFGCRRFHGAFRRCTWIRRWWSWPQETRRSRTQGGLVCWPRVQAGGPQAAQAPGTSQKPGH